MASQISAANATLFESLVKHHYQLASFDDLMGACRVKQVMNAKTVQFPIIGTVSMGTKNYRTFQPTTNPTLVQVPCTISDYYVAVPSDIQEAAKVTFDELQELAPVVAKAVKRRALQIKIDALAATASTLTVAKNYDSTNAMSAVKVRKAAQLLNKANVDPTDRHALIHATGAAQLIQDPELSDADLSSLKRLESARLGEWHGFMFHVIGDGTTEDAGLPLATNDRSNFFWHKDSLGFADQLMNTAIEWSVDQDCYLVKARLSAGAVAIEDSTNSNFGIAVVTSDDSVALS